MTIRQRKRQTDNQKATQQTIQWPKEKGRKDEKWSTNHGTEN
jgi:hypothetical protein